MAFSSADTFEADYTAGEELVKEPCARFRAADLVPTLTRYSEIRALVGGVPAVQGVSVNAQVLDEALVRNVDRRIFGQQAADDPRALVGMVTWDAASIAGLTGRVGDLQPGMPADVCVLERCHEDPWESVLRSDPSAVQLVTIGGNLVYARTDWYDRLTDDPHGEQVWAWGRQMTLDTTYSVPTGTSAPPRLAELRKAILDADIAAGPIFA